MCFTFSGCPIQFSREVTEYKKTNCKKYTTNNIVYYLKYDKYVRQEKK